MENQKAEPAKGKLGVLVVGLGAVTSTFMTGVLMARKGLAKPVGSMTQYDKIRVGEGADKKYLKYKDIIPLATLDDIVFGAWDVYPANAFESAVNAEEVLVVGDSIKNDIEPARKLGCQTLLLEGKGWNASPLTTEGSTIKRLDEILGFLENA